MTTIPAGDDGWHDINPETGKAETMPTDSQHVWLDNGVSVILGSYRRLIGPGQEWCDRFERPLTYTPRAWRALDIPPPPQHMAVWGER